MLEDLEDQLAEDLFVVDLEMLENLEDLFVEMLEDQRDPVEWWVDEVVINQETKCMAGEVKLDEEQINHH